MPLIGNIITGLLRSKTVCKYMYGRWIAAIRWLFNSRETTNFTYDLDGDNKKYLATLISDIMNIKYDEVLAYIREIEEDEELKTHILTVTSKSQYSFMADKEVRYGRRIGWYALARILKPNIIVETGVDKGLGACVLTAALKRNAEEGYQGRYYGTDINPNAGYLLTGIYSDFGEILYGDSITSLSKFNQPIDLFINDSDHSAEYEAREYKTIQNKLTENAIILGDNSHCTDKLLEFSLETSRHFIFFQEKPSKHWYPGAGIGISFIR